MKKHANTIFAVYVVGVLLIVFYFAGKKNADRWWQKHPKREPVYLYPYPQINFTGAEVSIPLDLALAGEIQRSRSSARLLNLKWQASLSITLNSQNGSKVWYCVSVRKIAKTKGYAAPARVAWVSEACGESLAAATDDALNPSLAAQPSGQSKEK